MNNSPSLYVTKVNLTMNTQLLSQQLMHITTIVDPCATAIFQPLPSPVSDILVSIPSTSLITQLLNIITVYNNNLPIACQI